MNADLEEVIKRYITNTSELSDLKTQVAELRDSLKDDEEQILEHLQNGSLNELTFGDKRFIIKERKVTKTVKKEDMISKLQEELKNIKKIPVEIDKDINCEKIFSKIVSTENCLKMRAV